MIKKINDLLCLLFPIQRSIASPGVRNTLNLLKKIADFNILSFKSGLKVFDWTIPEEWEVESATISDLNSNVLIDYKDNPLYLASFSNSFCGIVSKEELFTRIHSIKGFPSAIPYRTNYYNNDWNFCIDYKTLLTLKDYDNFFVDIKTKFSDGFLNVGEKVLKGKCNEEYIFHTYCCHPSLANDNLSGIVLWILLLEYLSSLKNLNKTYRFVIAPETIGTIAYLNRNKNNLDNVSGGFILTTLAGPDQYKYKKSFLYNSKIDRVAIYVLNKTKKAYKIEDFSVMGSDERQYSSPGFRIPFGTITKSKYYDYKEYHTSKDDLSFIKANYLKESLELYKEIFYILDHDFVPVRVNPYCEPMLSKYKMYNSDGGSIKTFSNSNTSEIELILTILFYSDGETSIFDICEKNDINFYDALSISIKLKDNNLIK